MDISSADGLIIRNSKFWNCQFQDVLITYFAPGGALPPANILIEHNWIEKNDPYGYYSLAFGAEEGQVVRNVTVLYNSLLQDISIAGSFFSNFSVIGNVGPMFFFQAEDGIRDA